MGAACSGRPARCCSYSLDSARWRRGVKRAPARNNAPPPPHRSLVVQVVQCAAPGEVAVALRDADVAVPLMARLGAEELQGAHRLKLICQFGVGVEGVSIPLATSLGIWVTNVPSRETGNALSCAEHAIYLMLAVLRRHNAMADRCWARAARLARRATARALTPPAPPPPLALQHPAAAAGGASGHDAVRAHCASNRLGGHRPSAGHAVRRQAGLDACRCPPLTRVSPAPCCCCCTCVQAAGVWRAHPGAAPLALAGAGAGQRERQQR